MLAKQCLCPSSHLWWKMTVTSNHSESHFRYAIKMWLGSRYTVLELEQYLLYTGWCSKILGCSICYTPSCINLEFRCQYFANEYCDTLKYWLWSSILSMYYLCLSWLSQMKAWEFSTFCWISLDTTSRAWTSMVQMVMIRWRLALVMSPSRRWISVFSWVTCKMDICRYKLSMPRLNSEASERLSFLHNVMWPVCCCIECLVMYARRRPFGTMFLK